jgi:predicted alpha/beta-fold hydrolase
MHVNCDFPGEGGHAAFVSGPFPGNLGWMPRRVTGFFEHALAADG